MSTSTSITTHWGVLITTTNRTYVMDYAEHFDAAEAHVRDFTPNEHFLSIEIVSRPVTTTLIEGDWKPLEKEDSDEH